MVAYLLRTIRAWDSGCPWLQGILPSKSMLNAHGAPASLRDRDMLPLGRPKDGGRHDPTIRAVGNRFRLACLDKNRTFFHQSA